MGILQRIRKLEQLFKVDQDTTVYYFWRVNYDPDTEEEQQELELLLECEKILEDNSDRFKSLITKDYGTTTTVMLTKDDLIKYVNELKERGYNHDN